MEKYISEEKLQELIDDVPDVDNPEEVCISYWQKINDKLIYLEGWVDACLAGTGFPTIERGGTAEKIAYIEDLTPEILQRKARERGLKFLDGGFKETTDTEYLYGVTYGIYEKEPEKPMVPEPIAFEKRLEAELKRYGFIAGTGLSIILPEEVDKAAVNLFIKRHGKEAYERGEIGETLERISQKAEDYDPAFLKKHPELRGKSIIVYHDPLRGEDLAVLNDETNEVVEILSMELRNEIASSKTNPVPEFRDSDSSIPKTYISRLGFDVEMPVARAVDVLWDYELPVSSGFHEKINNRWTIVFQDLISPKLRRLAKELGFEIEIRPVRGTTRKYIDVSLPDVSADDLEKATKAFDKLAERYLGKARFYERFGFNVGQGKLGQVPHKEPILSGNPTPIYLNVESLPEFRGVAWRAESGYRHPREATIADIIRFEREELGNEYPDISNELLEELDQYSASDAIWVNRRRKECLYYLSEGESEEAVGKVPLPEGSKIITPDYCGGYLVLKGSAKPKGSNSINKFDRLTEKQVEELQSMKEASRMAKPRTGEERVSFQERIFGKEIKSPFERLGEGEVTNKLLPMPPDIGPPLPRFIGLKWPWRE